MYASMRHASRSEVLGVFASRSFAAMKKDPNKPRGKMTSYAFFVATCREEHKKKHPSTPVGFAEFSKKCSERWRVIHSFIYLFFTFNKGY